MASGYKLRFCDESGKFLDIPKFQITEVRPKARGTYFAASFGRMIIQDNNGKPLKLSDSEAGKIVYVQFVGQSRFITAKVC